MLWESDVLSEGAAADLRAGGVTVGVRRLLPRFGSRFEPLLAATENGNVVAWIGCE